MSSPLLASQTPKKGPGKEYQKPDTKPFKSLAKALTSAEKKATSKTRIGKKHKKFRTKYVHKTGGTKKFAHSKRVASKKAYCSHWKSKKKHAIKSRFHKKAALKKTPSKKKTGRSYRTYSRG